MTRRPVSLLIVEDSVDDAELLLRELARAGFDVTHTRVEQDADFRRALAAGGFDAVLCDWSLPRFGAPQALAAVKAAGVDLPFLIISGAVGEETAIEALKAGAHDFLVKGRFARLGPALTRELNEADTRRRRRDAEASLRESEERFRTLVQSMNDLAFTFDREQRCTGVYGTWPETSTATPRDFLGKSIAEMQGDATGLHQRENARALAGERVVYEFNGITTRRNFQSSLAPLRDELGAVSGVVAVIRDITDQKTLQNQLLASERLAAVGSLAAGVCHDINNPLTALLNDLELAEREARRLGAVDLLPELLAEAKTAAERVRQLARDLKVFSRIEGGRGAVDVERVLDSAQHLAEQEVRHRARVAKRYAGVPPAEGYESRLGQVFLSLMLETARAMGEVRGGTLELVTGTDAQGRVTVEISGSGAALVEDATNGSPVSVCRRLVESMDGWLELDGAKCLIVLPQAKTATTQAGRIASRAAASRRGRVLVIDDERVLASSMCRLIAPQHDVQMVLRAEDAFSRIEGGERFDVILSDLMMPEMTGMDLHERLMSVAPDQAANMIFMTGGAFTARARGFLDSIANARLEKPFDGQHLLGLLNDRVR